MMSATDRDLLRYSLVLVWLATAVASIWEMDGQSSQLMANAGFSNRSTVHAVIWSGSLVDAMLGLALLLKPVRITFVLAFVAMLAMTLVATALLPSLWLHPLGPLSKNVPIAASLWILARSTS